MNYKEFPAECWQQINSTLQLLEKSGQKLYAAFDADGTLWDTDLGENFFQYQIDHRLVELPSSPWEHYHEMKKINNDPRAAYVWLAQINKNQKLDTVQQWSQKAFDSIQPSPIFKEQKKLIELLQKNNVQIYIVTASIKWAVEPGARALGLNTDQVIGIETAVSNGLITDEKLEPLTYKQGKAEALLKKTNQTRPFLAAGNTLGDFELLQCATHIRMAVSAASRDDRLFKSENELLQKAEENNWWRHRFI